jgi:hypothetical protein
MKSKTLICLLLFLVPAGGTVSAQSGPASAIVGRVLDAHGAPLPGVSVEAMSPALMGRATAVTAADGSYRLISLPTGTYEVTFTLSGFRSLVQKEIVITAGRTVKLDIRLEQGAGGEPVVVIGGPAIDVRSAAATRTMTRDMFMSLPRSRDFTGLLGTIPGVQYEDRLGGLTVDGATGTENAWLMDGADIGTGRIGVQGQSAIMEGLDEVSVTSSGRGADTGGSMGGVVSVVTRSGGNAFHGGIAVYYNDNSKLMLGKSRDYLRWNPYNNSISEYVNDDDLYGRDPYKRYEVAVSLGGYVLKDKLWFFVQFDPQYSRQTGTRSIFNDGGTYDRDFYQKRWWWNGQAKLTAAPFEGLRLGASFVNNFSKYRGGIPADYTDVALIDDYVNEGYDYPNFSAAFAADYVVNRNFVIGARVGYAVQNVKNQQVANDFTTYYNNTSSYVYEGIIPDQDLYYTGAINYSGSRTMLVRQKQHKYSANVDFTYYMTLGGEHAWKAGFQWIKNHEDYLDGAYYPMVNLYWNQSCADLVPYYDPDSTDPVYSNPELATAFRGDYGYYVVRGSWTSPYGSAWNIKRNSFALYLQDSWTINGRLTINAGLRAESEYIPSFNSEYAAKPIKFGFGDKLAPRLGVVYDVFGDSRFKIFGSFGIYYDTMKLSLAENAYGGFKWKSDYYTLDNYDFWEIANEYLAGDTSAAAQADQAAGGTYMGTIDYRVPSFDTTDPDLKPTAQSEITFGFEKQLSRDLSLSVRFVRKHLIRTIEDIGLPGESGTVYYIANPGSAYIQEKLAGVLGDEYLAEPKAKREYSGLNISLEKRLSHNWQGGFSYTWSRATGNYSGLSSADESDTAGRNAPNAEQAFDAWYSMYTWEGNLLDGVLPQDRTHYLKAYGSYTFPFGLTVGAAAYGRSGLPLSTRLLVNNLYMYPEGFGDMGRLPFTVWADLYLEYALKISGRYQAAINLQINNVTNTKTWQSMVTNVNRTSITFSDAMILAYMNGGYDWDDFIADYYPNIQYGQHSTRFGTWSARLGLRFSF